MKVKAERCGICLSWHLLIAHKHCPNCGAYHLHVNNKHLYVNRNGVEMVRGVPLSLQSVMERLEAK